jgi:predicted lipopolysaccharide heptosyltransferase III
VKILLVRLRLIGDVVFTTPAVRALRRRFPDAHLTYLVEPDAAPVVRGNPHLDRVLIVPRPAGRGSLVADLRLASALRSSRFDLVIDFHGGPRSCWLTLATGAPKRIGYTVSGRSWMYTERVARPRALRARHSVENQWDLLTPLGIGPPDPARDPTEMTADPAAATSVERRLRDAGISGDEELIVLHVSAGNPFRRWPEAAFTGLVARLADRERRRVIVTSGPSDRNAALAVREAARRLLPARAASRVMDPGDFDLAELRALIDRAALFVGGDSGPLHVASTTRTPIVGLFGPTLAARSAPWRDPRWIAESIELADLACRPCDQRHCVTHDYRCLGNITVEMVAAAAERVLARRCEAIATRDLEPATTDQGDSSPDPRSLIPDPLSE